MDRDHHTPAGFRNPWASANGDRQPSVLRWWWERRQKNLSPTPGRNELPRAKSSIAVPRAEPLALEATWIGHATYLVQVGGRNLLTDPHWSERASPLRYVGPRRFSAPGVALEALPPIDAVLISHDHYDHLDEPTVRALIERHGDLTWFAPLGHRAWLSRRGARRIVELDWWESAELHGLQLRLLPAQHWSSRSFFDRFKRLWGSWGVRADGGRSVYFGGDSGWFPGYGEIGERAGPFDLVLMPIGAYEPRWFMKPAHMNPAEAVQAYQEMGGTGVLGAMHWGTFRLTDEEPLEPPRLLRQAWSHAGLNLRDLWIPAHGESRTIRPV